MSIHPVQRPRWLSKFAPGIIAKFKDFSGEISKKQKKSTKASWFLHKLGCEIMFKKCRDSVKHVVTHHLTLINNYQTFYSQMFVFV